MNRLFLLILALIFTAIAAESASAYYHPTLGRFMQRDPHGTALAPSSSRGFIPRERAGAGYPDGMSTYAAYHVMHGTVDPSGMQKPRKGPRKCCPGGEEAQAVLAVGPFDAYHAAQLAGEAGAMVRRLNEGMPGNASDALRHCYWSCRMAQDLGHDQAKKVGDIHERCGKNSKAESDQDLANNRIGRNLANGTPPLIEIRGRKKLEELNRRRQENLKTKQNHCIDACRDAWDDGTLVRGNP